MKAKTKFLKMYYKLPNEAKTELVCDFAVNPMSLSVVAVEVRGNTELSKMLLEKLGYKDE